MINQKKYGSHYWLSEYIGIGGPQFSDKLELLLSMPNIEIIPDSNIPMNRQNPKEYSVETYIKEHLNDFSIDNWDDKRKNWWTATGGKRPTWDMICEANIYGKRGLVLVEAKAHASECSSASKAPPKETDSKGTIDNHKRIMECIKEAFDNLNIRYTDSYYQVTNRISYAWWVSRKLQIPVILMFLGFIGDDHFPDRFFSADQWVGEISDVLGKLNAEKLLPKDTKAVSENQFVIIRNLPAAPSKLSEGS